jgi:competence protein ComEC
LASVTFLDVGHGTSIVITSGRSSVVLDTGRGATLLEHLEENEIEHVEQVLLSHSDADHINGLIALLSAKKVTVGEVWLNTDALQGSKSWAGLVYELDELEQSETTVLQTSLVKGQSFVLEEISIDVVAPRKRLAALGPGSTDRDGRHITTNSISAMVRVSSGGRVVVLITGDIDETGLDHAIDSDASLRAPVLLFPHHGGRVSPGSTPTRNRDFAALLTEKVHPHTVIFSLARGQHNTPRPEIIEAIHAFDESIRIACTQLSEHCADKPPQTSPTHLLPIAAKGLRKKHCCAGSLQIILPEDGEIYPSRSEHVDFITQNAPTALCRQFAQ